MATLKQMTDALVEKFKSICENNPYIKGHVFEGDKNVSKTKGTVIVNIRHCYFETIHEGRDSVLCGHRFLSEWNESERKLVELVVIELAGDQFATKLARFVEGAGTYVLIPKDPPAA